MRFILTLLVLIMCLGAGHPTFAFGAPKSELWDRWIRHDPKSKIRINHQVWAEFLTKYLVVDEDGINRVAYGRVSSKSKAALKRYVRSLENTNVDTLARPEQRAYWINLYNALTVKVVLDHYPVETIQDIDISPGFFESGPWGKKLLKIRGESLSLNDISSTESCDPFGRTRAYITPLTVRLSAVRIY